MILIGWLAALAGCFDVTYRFVEDGVHDYGPLTVTEEIVQEAPGGSTEDGATFVHFQVTPTGRMRHFSEVWTQLASGEWNQRILMPSGAFHYECTAPVQQQQWRCAVPGAPKPRRDSARTDYANLDRENTVQMTPNGWVQAETNVKRGADGSTVSREVGWVEYRRIDASRCPAHESR